MTRRCDCGGCESCAPEYHGEDEAPREPRCRDCWARIEPGDLWCSACRPPLLAYEFWHLPVDPNPRED